MHVFKTKIKLEIVGANLVIEDADISVDLTKTDEEKSRNTCEIVIYNVSDTTYNKIKDETRSVRIYTDVDGKGYCLLFDGLLRDAQKVKYSKAKKKPKKVLSVTDQPQVKREVENNDIATTIYLEDGIKSTILTNYITKSYSGQVTNRFVLDDILQSVKRNSSNVKISANTSSLDEYTYPNGVVFKGSLKSVLTKICRTGNAYCTVQNDVILISSENRDKEGAVYTYLLNGYNCPSPEIDSKNLLKIQAPFISSVNPFNFVKLDFKDYQGLYQVKKVESKIDNFGENYETNLVVKKA